jgi:hypothetical protein
MVKGAYLVIKIKDKNMKGQAENRINAESRTWIRIKVLRISDTPHLLISRYCIYRRDLYFTDVYRILGYHPESKEKKIGRTTR